MSKNTKSLFTSPLFLSLTLIIISFLTYLNILPNQLFFDDEELIYRNEYVKDIRNLPKYFTENMIAGAGKVSNMYRPVLLTSFAIDHLFWKDNPIGYHLTSIFLHAANAILIFFLIRKVFKNKLLSFLTSLFFIIHPVNSEAIIYASGRTDPLYSFFTLLSIIFFLRHLERSSFCEVARNNKASLEVERSKRSCRLNYTLSIIFFILALLSKETAIILPGLLLLIYIVDEIKRKRRFQLARLLLYISPFILIDIIYILLRLTVLNFGGTLNFYQTQTLYSQNLLVRLYTFTRVFFQYLKLFLFPKDLMIARQTTVITSPANIYVFIFILIIGTLITLSLWQVKKKNPVYLFSFLWFFITIGPVSGIIPINNIIAEHYLYLPSISFFLLVSYIFIALWKKYSKLNIKTILISFLTIICLTLSIRTIIRTFDWRDPITFYTKSIKQSPENIPMRHNLAMAYGEKGELEKAIKEYENLIELADVYPNTHHNLANAYKAIGKYKEAEKEYKKALGMDPNFHFSLYGLADLYQKMGEKKKLEEIINKIRISRFEFRIYE